jgi:hypothetical protein
MADSVDLCNRALQKLGARTIASLSEQSRNAIACNVAYGAVLAAELEEHYWSFAIKRAVLAASATAPLFGKALQFPLPSDFLKRMPPDPDFIAPLTQSPVTSVTFTDDDFVIEGGMLLSNLPAPYYLRYVALVTTVDAMPPLFRETVSTRLASELCEEITQSNSKKADLQAQYKDIVARAKKSNAIQKAPAVPSTDSFLSSRA